MELTQSSFKEFICGQLHQINSSLPLEIKEYLSDLLCFYIRTHRMYEHRNKKGRYHRATLVEIYGKIPKAGINETVYLFKKIGDTSLCFSGFFRGSLNKKIVNRSYYEDMGQAAYGRLGALYEGQNNIFQSLSDNFKVLGETLFCLQKKTESLAEKNRLKAFYISN